MKSRSCHRCRAGEKVTFRDLLSLTDSSDFDELMAGWYYTDHWRRQFGPVEDSLLLEMNDNGVISAETAVWKEGMEAWLPFRSVAGQLFEKDAKGNHPEVAVCAYSGKVLDRKEMLPYGEALIGVESKQAFVQSLMETGRTMVADATERGVKYIGFWWRLLGVLLDEMVKLGIMAILGGILAAIFFGIMTYFKVASDSDAVIGIFMAGVLVIVYGAGAVYEIWMVGKYQGTLGKLVIGAKIVQPDLSRVSYKRSLGRWLAKVPLFLETLKFLPYFMLFFFIGMMTSGFKSDNSAFMVASWFLALTLPVIVLLVISSAFWMAAFDDEKRALHDRIASTRVVPK